MTKHRQLLEGVRLPQDWLDSIQEYLGSYVSPNFNVVIQTNTSLRVPAGPDNAQVCIAINGRWRYVSANVDAAAPGGLTAGDNPLFVAASDNVFGSNPSPPPTELDSTDYTFRLIVKPAGQTPSGTGAEALWRQVGVVTWSGTAFTAVKLTVGASGVVGLGAGVILDFGGYEEDIPANTTTCDGHQESQAGRAALWSKLTHGGARPNKWDTFGGLPAPSAGNFRVPDLRGRGTVGTNVMGVANATSPPTIVGNYISRAAANAVGVLMGEEYHTLTVAEIPSLGSVTTSTESADHIHSGSTGYISNDHGHSGTTAGRNAAHNHGDYGHYHTTQNNWDGSTSGNFGTFVQTDHGATNNGNTNYGYANLATESADHAHSFSTGGVSANHTHNFSTGGRSVAHTHVAVLPGAGGSHETVFPVATVVKVITYS